jgi:hypothetical protein
LIKHAATAPIHTNPSIQRHHIYARCRTTKELFSGEVAVAQSLRRRCNYGAMESGRLSLRTCFFLCNAPGPNLHGGAADEKQLFTGRLCNQLMQNDKLIEDGQERNT